MQRRVGFAHRDADDALPGRGHHQLGVEHRHRHVTQAKPADPRQGQQARGAVAAPHLVDPRLHIAAQQRRAQVRPRMQQLRRPPQRVGADHGAGRQHAPGIALTRRRAVGPQDQHVAGVLALQRAGEHDAGRQLGLEVLQAVHREVDAAVEQRLVDLLAEQALAADLCQRAVLHRIAGGADDVLLEHRLPLHAERQHRAEPGQQIQEAARLGARQR